MKRRLCVGLAGTGILWGLASCSDTTTSPAPPMPVAMEFVQLPAASFVMGDTSCVGMRAQPTTLTEDFYLGQTEVTNEQYMGMVQWAYENGYVTATSSSVKDAVRSDQELLDLDDAHCEIAFSDGLFSLRPAQDLYRGINPDHPVKEVTWYGAAAFCDWMSFREGLRPAYADSAWRCNEGDPYRAEGYRLPTTVEWEYAAQYPDARINPWGNEPPSCDRANSYGCNNSWTEPVASQVAGPEKVIDGKGLYDMSGNVSEWCNDWYVFDADVAPRDSPGPAVGTERLLRGGAWNSRAPQNSNLRCAYTHDDPRVSLFNYGFRVARTVSP